MSILQVYSLIHKAQSSGHVAFWYRGVVVEALNPSLSEFEWSYMCNM
jgi:hypothetical protein